MRIAAIIPARFGSSRFEGKPLADIAGKAMIQHVYENARRSARVDQVVVATDDQRIYEAVRQFGGQVLMTAAKHRSGTDRVAEAARILGLSASDIVINVQGDQPMVNPKCFDQVVEPLMSNDKLGMSTLAFTIIDPREYDNPKDCKVILDYKGFALYFSRAPIPYDRDGRQAFDAYKHLGIYAYTCRFLDVFTRLPVGRLESVEKLEQLRALEFGHRIRVVITSYDSPEVDLPEDIPRIEKRMQQLS